MDFASDAYFMGEALKEAQRAMQNNEIPVGAVAVVHNKVIARAHNGVEQLVDATAHAELLAVTAACNYLGSKYLTNCTLYVTLEPCVMCGGALNWAQLGRLVFGAYDAYRGYSSVGMAVLHRRTKVSGGIRGDESRLLLDGFFKKIRN